MKKFLLSSTIIVSFFAYSIYYRLTAASAYPSEAPPQRGEGGPTPSPTPSPVPVPQPTSPPPRPSVAPSSTPGGGGKPASQYKDSSYTGDSFDAFYGFIQVRATISGSRLTNIEFLQFPNDRSTSREINAQADPMLAREAIQAQSAQVDVISGATDSSLAFIQSLQSALNKAKN